MRGKWKLKKEVHICETNVNTRGLIEVKMNVIEKSIQYFITLRSKIFEIK